jgi:aminoglycoside 3-N-acetyltransferase
VGHDKNTSLHLAEHKARYPGKRIVTDGFPLVRNGTREWYEHEDILYYADDFPEIGRAFEATRACGVGYIGNARSVLCSQRALVDFAVEWMEKNRDLS